MATNLTPAVGVSGPATELIARIEAQGFKSHGKPLSKFAPWQRLKRVVSHMELAVHRCWQIVAEVREQIKLLVLRQKRTKSLDTTSRR